jgi:hypothetical protein
MTSYKDGFDNVGNIPRMYLKCNECGYETQKVKYDDNVIENLTLAWNNM